MKKPQKLFVTCDMDMVEIAMEIENQFSDEDEVSVYYDDCDEDMDIEEGDLVGTFTIEGLKECGYIS